MVAEPANIPIKSMRGLPKTSHLKDRMSEMDMLLDGTILLTPVLVVVAKRIVAPVLLFELGFTTSS